MKAIHAGSGLLVITLVLAFFVSGNAVSENSAISQTDSKPHSVSTETSHPLAMAHQQLE